MGVTRALLTRTATATGALALVLATAACAAVSTPVRAGWVTPAATPTPAIDRYAEMKPLVDAAGLTPKDIGVTKPKSESTTIKITLPCGFTAIAEQKGAHHWTYSDAKPAVSSHAVYAYHPERGAEVVDQARSFLAKCKTWIWGGTWDMTLIGELKVTQPAGVDNALAYCHHGKVIKGASKGNEVYLCDGVVGRGHLVAEVGTVQSTLAKAQSELKKALPLIAAALVKAVPDS